MKLDQHYSDFGGLDTRSNYLKQPPTTVRRGSKNFRYNFQDELQPANGFQHKSSDFTYDIVGQVEYKYQDINTGEAKSEYLAICTDGNLYRKTGHFLKFTDLNGLTSYSFFYNEDTSLFNFVAYVGATPTTYAFNNTVDMDTLRSNINSLTGATCVVVDDDGSTVTSTRKAYLIDVIIGKALTVNEVILEASAWDYTLVEYPSSAAGIPLVPFETTKDFYSDDNYEGISYINLNNVCYITDGGFPMKYDGYQVYRMGMPRVLQNKGLTFTEDADDENFSGFEVNVSSSPVGLLTSGAYKYIFQYGFVDSNGAETLGAIEGGESKGYLQSADVVTPTTNTNNLLLNVGALPSSFNFPIWSCIVDGYQNLTASGGTITVESGHNIKVGMLLRIPIRNYGASSTTLQGFSYIMSYVSAVTATTITVDYGIDPESSGPYLRIQPFNNYILDFTGDITSGTNTILNVTGTGPFPPTIGPGNVGDFIIDPLFPFGTTITNVSGTTVTTSANATGSGTTNAFQVQDCPYLLGDGAILQGGYASDNYKNTITDIIEGEEYFPRIHFGAFVRVYRTLVDGDVFYRMGDFPVSWNNLDPTYKDLIADSALTIPFDDSDSGELPRACKYLATWQNQIIQAGRPVDPTIANDNYPSLSAVGGTPENQWGEVPNTYFGYLVSEAGLCDFQSYYWNSTLAPEGFPVSGLFQNAAISDYNDSIKGIGTNKDAMFIFKQRTTAIVTGDLAVGELNQEFFEEDVGCANFRTIQNVDGAVVWLDPLNGFYSCVAGRLPVPIGYSIQDEFKINPDGLDFNRSFAQNFEPENLYVCVVDTKMFIFDYAKTSNNSNRLCWYLWDSLSAASLLSTANSEFLLSDSDRIWKLKLTNTKYDLSNNTTAIDFKYYTAWLTYGKPTIDKHFVNVWVNSIQGDFTLTVKEFGNYNDTSISDYVVTFPAQSSSSLTVKQQVKAKQRKLSGYSVGFENNVLQDYVRLQGFEIELAPEYSLEEPRR